MRLLVLAAPRAPAAQSFALYGSAGPTMTDAGNSVAAGGAIAPAPQLTVMFGVERTHLATRIRQDRDLTSIFRGGTLVLGAAELRYAPLGRHRVGPYGLAGFAAGVSRPNVNGSFPDRVTNQARAVFAGGGIQIPAGDRLTVFVDGRMIVGAEGTEGLLAIAPLRAGITWRF
jgi:hypothetical protein